MIVLDASVVLAAFLGEPGGDVLGSIKDDYRISAFNLGEVASKLTEKGYRDSEVHAAVAPFVINSVPVAAALAVQAGLWRKSTKSAGLSMGDRICLALGLELGAEVYTAERVWARLDLGVRVRLIR